MSGILIFGGGDIATKGVIPVVGGTICDVDVTNRDAILRALHDHDPETVINCAGVSKPGIIANSAHESELMVNLHGAFNIAMYCGGLTQIHIASVSGLYGKANHSGYCASKAGVISLVQSLAMEGHNAYVISPGRVDTRLRERDYPNEDRRTRLWPTQIGMVVDTILKGGYLPGDNIIIRKRGFDTELRIDRGEPWFDWLDIGKPPV